MQKMDYDYLFFQGMQRIKSWSPPTPPSQHKHLCTQMQIPFFYFLQTLRSFDPCTLTWAKFLLDLDIALQPNPKVCPIHCDIMADNNSLLHLSILPTTQMMIHQCCPGTAFPSKHFYVSHGHVLKALVILCEGMNNKSVKPLVNQTLPHDVTCGKVAL